MKKEATQKNLVRVLDANLNRVKEGLRVCEDIVRFFYNEKGITAAFKNMRHEITDIAAGFESKMLVGSRDVTADVGRLTTVSETVRKDVEGLFCANIQRVKESLRVLEEFSKFFDVKIAESFKLIRYKVYDLEKKTLELM